MKRISRPVVHQCRPSGIKIFRSARGQATVEYVLLLIIIISGALVLIRGLQRTDAMSSLAMPIQEQYARAYQYGHPKAKAEDGVYEMHPRMGNYQSEEDVVQSRIFIYLGSR